MAARRNSGTPSYREMKNNESLSSYTPLFPLARGRSAPFRKSRRSFSPSGRATEGIQPAVPYEKRGLPLAFFWESVYETSLWCGQSVPLERFFRATRPNIWRMSCQAVRIFGGKKPQTGNYVSHSNIKTKRVFNPQPSERASPVRQRRSPHGFRVHPLPALRRGYETRCPQGD